jgi:hypothetical protein
MQNPYRLMIVIHIWVDDIVSRGSARIGTLKVQVFLP